MAHLLRNGIISLVILCINTVSWEPSRERVQILPGSFS